MSRRRRGADAVALNNRGAKLYRAGRTDEAISAFRAALAADAAHADAAGNLGKALADAGDVAEALTWLERAIELAPDNAHFYFPLATGWPAHVRPAHRDALAQLARRAEALPVAQQIDLHFALAAVYEHDARIADAFRHYQAGNALKRKQVAYDERAALAFLQSTESAFGNPWMQQLRGCGDPSARPVFIFGMPRTGSTLVEQLLAAHPAVATAGETGTLGEIVRTVWPKITANGVEELRAAVRGIGERYLRVTDGLAANAARLTDKTLDNLQLAPLIHVTLPNARMIHVVRDPLDTCFSSYATSFTGAQVPFSYELGEIGRYYRAAMRMMARWSAFVPSERLLELRYEDLVGDFEATARRIVAFCGLPWDPACLAFHDVRRPVRTASNLQVRRPLYRSSLGRAQAFAPYLAPLIDALAAP